MANTQLLKSAEVKLFHELLNIDSLSQYRFVAMVDAVNFDKFLIQLRCPGCHHCDTCGKVSCSIRFAAIHGFVQQGDFVEIVGSLDELPGEQSLKSLSFECWILRNINGLNFKNYVDSVHLLRKMTATAA